MLTALFKPVLFAYMVSLHTFTPLACLNRGHATLRDVSNQLALNVGSPTWKSAPVEHEVELCINRKVGRSVPGYSGDIRRKCYTLKDISLRDKSLQMLTGSSRFCQREASLLFYFYPTT